MGWWRVHYDLTTDDCIGDTPADILGDALEIIVAQRSRQGKKKPDLQEYLDAFTALLQTYGSHLYHEGRRLAIDHIVARIRLHDGTFSQEFIANPSSPSDEGLFAQCRDALEGITEAYWEAFDRAPRLREVLATIEFVLSDNYCSDQLAFQLEEITAGTHWIWPREHVWSYLYGPILTMTLLTSLFRILCDTSSPVHLLMLLEALLARSLILIRKAAQRGDRRMRGNDINNS